MKKCILWGETGSQKGLGETLTIKKNIFNLHFKCQQNMYLTILKFKKVLRSRKGLDYNTATLYNLCDSLSFLVKLIWTKKCH